MDIKSIRDKYKMIINCEDNHNQDNINNINMNMNKQNYLSGQQSDREWIKIIKNQQKKKVFTQATYHNNLNNKQKSINSKKNKQFIKSQNKKQSHSSTYQSTIITLKQKLAQSIHDSKTKSTQIQSLQNLITQKNQQIKHLTLSINHIKSEYQQKQNIILQQQHKLKLAQLKLQQKNQQIKSQQIDNELLNTQIEHYRKQIQMLNLKYQKKQLEYESFGKELKRNTQLKNKVDRLKDDVKRLQFLLSDNQIYTQLFVSLQGKHFLGKSNKQGKQLQYWYPQILIQGVERFLKRQKIGYGNKQFTQNIVKFLYSLLDRNDKKCEKKCKSIYNSRIKQIQRKKNHILNIIDVTRSQVGQNHQGIKYDTKKCSQYNSNNSRLCASQLRRTTMTLNNTNYSGQKSKGFSICMNNIKKSPLCRSITSQLKNNYSTVLPLSAKKSFLIQGLQKSVRLNTEKNKSFLLDLVDSLCDGVEKIFKKFMDKDGKGNNSNNNINNNKNNGIEKIYELCEWFKESVEEIFMNELKHFNMFEKNSRKGVDHEKDYNSKAKWKTVAAEM